MTFYFIQAGCNLQYTYLFFFSRYKKITCIQSSSYWISGHILLCHSLQQMSFDKHKIRQLEKGYKAKLKFLQILRLLSGTFFFHLLTDAIMIKATTNSSKKGENEQLLLIYHIFIQDPLSVILSVVLSYSCHIPVVLSQLRNAELFFMFK